MSLNQAAGTRIYGYRAPSFSITLDSLWAFEELAALGFLYDSSIFPVRHDVYGIPRATRAPFHADSPAGPVTEFPLTTFRIGGGPNLPVAGGGYLRMLPFAYTRAGVERVWREGLTVIAYVHPWELDPDQPRLNGPLKSRLRHYTNLNKTEARLRKLLALGGFTSFRDSGLEGSAPEMTANRLRKAVGG
jgi:polysaccharide deacetylase family protein (PEP-CTERM system associated)